MPHQPPYMLIWFAASLGAFAACSSEDPGGGDTQVTDARARDARPERDAETEDAVEHDAGTVDAADAASADGAPDSAAPDGGPDAEIADAEPDAGVIDSGAFDDLSDEFDDPSTFSRWRLRDVVEGTPAQYSTLDIDTSTPDHLTIVPTLSYWYDDEVGTFMYKEVTGDFVMRTYVACYDPMNAGQPPPAPNNTAGIMVRDPASTAGNENWIEMANGQALGFPGAQEINTTGSMSVRSEVGTSNVIELIICRIQDEFRLYYRPVGQVMWSPRLLYMRSDLPATLQVGMVANAAQSERIRAEFDWIRFAVPASESDCTVDIPPR